MLGLGDQWKRVPGSHWGREVGRETGRQGHQMPLAVDFQQVQLRCTDLYWHYGRGQMIHPCIHILSCDNMWESHDIVWSYTFTFIPILFLASLYPLTAKMSAMILELWYAILDIKYDIGALILYWSYDTLYQTSNMISELRYAISDVWYDIGAPNCYIGCLIWYRSSDMLYRTSDMISELRSICYIGRPIWYRSAPNCYIGRLIWYWMSDMILELRYAVLDVRYYDIGAPIWYWSSNMLIGCPIWYWSSYYYDIGVPICYIGCPIWYWSSDMPYQTSDMILELQYITESCRHDKKW